MNPDKFYAFSSIVLGGITGILIVLPMAGSSETLSVPYQMSYTLLGAILGAMVGYRRRKSRYFTYFCIAAILCLSILSTKAIIRESDTTEASQS